MTLLDNPIWNALRTRQAHLALGDDRARRFPADIGPLAGIAEETPECYDALRGLLAGPSDVLVLFLPHEPEPLLGWNLLRTGPIYQMVRTEQPSEPLVVSGNIFAAKLDASDAPAMVELAELTEPGPFRLRTHELGNFYGIFHGDKLVSMAGKRIHLPGYVEISGVCTHPDARGLGAAGLLMSLVIREIEEAGDTPFLHVLTTNPAIRLYEKLGFRIQRTFYFAALGTEAAAQAAAPHPPNPNRCG